MSTLITHAVHDTLRHADLKAAKLVQGASAPTVSKPLPGGVSKHTRKRDALVRRERTSEDVRPAPKVPHAESRLRTCATDPDISANAGVATRRNGQPVAGPSRPPRKRTFLKSRVTEPNYGSPSSTPTPPAKPRDPSSSLSSSLSRSSSSPAYPLWMNPSRLLRRDSAERPPQYLDTPSFLHDSYDVSMLDDDPTVEHDPHLEEHSPEVRPVPYISPPPLPSPMLPPPLPVPVPVAARRPDPSPPPSFAAPSLALIPPSLSRPFVPPSQVPSGSQLTERPRTSQRPKVLGMRPMYPQNSKFQSKPKPFKVPFAKKPAGPSSSGATQAARTRSLSPVVPDPPYVAARLALQAAPEPELEMTARRPEPARMVDDEDEDEGPKDANSSADMWAALDAIE
ncbi:hypothetical protein K466DRAFT_157204 [Polyporus arcularius HHB13444]|uniref:Uncharacterized protein n=1 Tax=Polyporus arcularius HHB13444 TaxID=1314778 RepID=A0A5C3P9G7_9APHY|nr:hypothetical protein K466DRAFT_157204 [Polyporus arcularius HHB13444]